MREREGEKSAVVPRLLRMSQMTFRAPMVRFRLWPWAVGCSLGLSQGTQAGLGL